MGKKRIEWVDIVKCICILFVMVHHLEIESEYLYTFYSSFFLKAFFFTAGYVYVHKNNFNDFMVKKIRGLLVPWFIFSTLNILLSQVLSFNEHGNVWSELGWNLLQIRNHGDGIWFVAALFVAFVPFYFIIGWSKNENEDRRTKIVLFSSFVLSVVSLEYTQFMPSIFPWEGVELPWHLEYIFQAMFFMVLGYYFKNKWEQIFDKKNTAGTCMFLGIVYIMLIYMPIVFGFEFGKIVSMLHQYLREVVGVLFIISFSKKIKSNFYIAYVGQNTLIYFALHGKVMSIMQAVVKKVIPWIYDGIVENSVLSDLYAVAFAIVMSVVLIIPAWIINNYLPFMVGKKRQ